MKKKIVVLGSMNMDLTILAEPFPKKGETVNGSGYAQIPGGKGANQAVAAGRMKADISFISACGNDSFGDQLISQLRASNINTESVLRKDIHTGLALIIREADGDNRIILAAGANASLLPESAAQFEKIIKSADILLLQLEVPLETVEWAASAAKAGGTMVILDPAPAVPLSSDLLRNIDILLPNEHELGIVAEAAPDADQIKTAESLLERGTGTVVITQGAQGVTIVNSSGLTRIPAPDMKAVDTTAAGDTFAGVLAYGLAEGWDLEKSARLAVKAASISVTRVGAQSSIPWLEDII